MGQHRFYRSWINSDLVNFTVRDNETDILISAGKNLAKKAERIIRQYRQNIIDYIKIKPEFKTNLKPIPADKNAPAIIKSMLLSTKLCDVGPMAAVAGAISEFTGKALLKFTEEIILENGGDIFIKTDTERKLLIYAGTSPLSGKVGIKIQPEDGALGICTSSGTVGHSLSFGKADAVTVVSNNAVLADACATAVCNMVKTESNVESALNFAKSIEGIIGAVVIYKEKIGSIGQIELI